ncbi:hypothetical protein [Symbioplanes lichenis]|uniref:hypothetical protein n=1 Tax=Symbioplanes lichenis TaxID=1629072 RepID=UPI00273A04F6|nr:hypothetical protein [Actinoplanes lichenis]
MDIAEIFARTAAQAAVETVPSDTRRIGRRVLIGLSAVPLAAVMVLYGVGRAEQYEGGFLGEWYVRLALALAGVAAYGLVEWTRRRTSE